VRAVLGRALAWGSALILCGLIVVGLRVQQIHLGYELDALRGERARLAALISQLEVEVATLTSPGRIEARARQLGLTTPAPEQVRLAREYVTGGQGLSRRERRSVVAVVPAPQP
jgi:cell division protein FtsL